MDKSRQAICDILDEALTTVDEMEDGSLNDFAEVLDSGLVEFPPSLNDDTSSINCTEAAPISRKSNDERSEKFHNEGVRNKPSSKPKRPLSAYNLFFQLERENIISGGSISSLSTDEIFKMLKAKKNSRQPPKEKRKHRKTHGKISFANLAKSIADKWKTLDKERKAVFEQEAHQEKLRYKKRLEDWNDERSKEKTQEINLLPTLEESNHLSGLNTPTKVASFACNMQPIDSIMLCNNNRYSSRNLSQEGNTHRNQSDSHKETHPSASIHHSSCNCRGYIDNNCTVKDDPRDSGCIGCHWCVNYARQHACHNSSLRFPHEPAYDRMPSTLEYHLIHNGIGNSQQPYPFGSAYEFHNNEYYALTNDREPIEYEAMACQNRNLPSIFGPALHKASKSPNDELESFMKSLEHDQRFKP